MSINNSIFSSLSSSVGSSILGDDAFNILDLFTGGRQGVWYDPSDLATMFQESTGTTAVTADGQPVGLMYDKSRGDLFGDELITNDWATAYGYDNTVTSISASSFSSVINTTANRVYVWFNTIVGNTYSLTARPTSGAYANLYIRAGSSASGTIIENPPITTTYLITFTATSTTTSILFVSSVSDYAYDNVSVREVLGTTATQPVATKRPTYKDTPDRLEIDLVDDALLFDIPTGGIDGYMVIGTNDGTASYGVSLPAGSYELGGDYFPSNTINGFLLREGAVSKSDLSKVEKDFISKGAKASYGDVTNFTNYWRQKNITEFPLVDTSSAFNFNTTWLGNNLTSFPLIDASSVTNFQGAWRDNNLASFPLIDTSSAFNFINAWRDNNLKSFPLLDTSSVTNFLGTWQNNNLTSFPLIDTSSGISFDSTWRDNVALTDFPANMFDNCLATDFSFAFTNTALNQSSIDNILISINSNGTSNGTFDQSGGSAPSATGQTAIDAMRSRGWTITVTGGY